MGLLWFKTVRSIANTTMMKITNPIQCLMQACAKQNIAYQFLEGAQNIVQVNINSGLIFDNNRTPFNTEAMAKICLDKEYTYKLLNARIAMPKTIGFLDYNVQERYQEYLVYGSLPAIMEKIAEEFVYPIVIKMNQGALGQHVYLCNNEMIATQAIQTIYEKTTYPYDYIALAQSYIKAAQEFRAVFFRKQLVLCYQRVSGNPDFGVRYWDTDQSQVLPINDIEECTKITQFAQPALNIPGLNYVGLDIIKDNQGHYQLLEMNSGPQYNHYIEACGTDDIVEMYEKILMLERQYH